MTLNSSKSLTDVMELKVHVWLPTVAPMTIPMAIEMLDTNIKDRSWVKGKTAPQNADRDCKLDTLFHENHEIDTLFASRAGRALC